MLANGPIGVELATSRRSRGWPPSAQGGHSAFCRSQFGKRARLHRWARTASLMLVCPAVLPHLLAASAPPEDYAAWPGPPSGSVAWAGRWNRRHLISPSRLWTAGAAAARPDTEAMGTL